MEEKELNVSDYDNFEFTNLLKELQKETYEEDSIVRKLAIKYFGKDSLTNMMLLPFKFIPSIIERLEHKNYWLVDSVERYYFQSGRNYDTYKEVTFFVCANTGQRKEVVREIDIQVGNESALPEWAKVIDKRNRKLENGNNY